MGKTVAQNRKARHLYNIEDTLEAGIELTGTEIKSVRDSNLNLQDAYARIEHGEAWLVGVHIAPWAGGNRNNHEPLRTRKLLLHRRQIDELHGPHQGQGPDHGPAQRLLQRSRQGQGRSSAWRAARRTTTTAATSPRATPSATWIARSPMPCADASRGGPPRQNRCSTGIIVCPWGCVVSTGPEPRRVRAEVAIRPR